MTPSEFLSTVWPNEGTYCVVGIKNKKVKQHFCSSVEEAEAVVSKLTPQHADIYYAVAAFNDDTRAQDNVRSVKSFYLDLDCGEDKAADDAGYESQAAAILALKNFCGAYALPAPTIVNSGRGIHAYWILETPVTAAAWQPVADALKRACNKSGLNADPAVTADSARILRIPGTSNYKDNPPKPVYILRAGRFIQLSDMQEALADFMKPVSTPAILAVPAHMRELNDVTKALLGNKVSRFSTIATKSLKGVGCNQIANIIKNQANIDEPLWRAGLSIAQCCVDAVTAIHKMSSKHPEYDAEATTRKAEETQGPYKCETFAQLNITGCSNCRHCITSPIQLGVEIQEYVAPEVAVEEPEVISFSPPYPYFRGANGGIYRRERTIEGEISELLVYENDLYVSDRIYDQQYGECAVINLHLPMDGLRQFTTPLKIIQSPDKFRDELSSKGVATTNMKAIMNYTTAYIKDLQAKMKAAEARMQFGWTAGDKKFILGNREISATKTAYSPSSSATTKLAPYLTATGDLETWKKAFHVYNNDQSYAQAFAVMAAFGAPLLRFTGVKGALLSLTNTKSGTGKTSVLKLINSVWGHPDELMLTRDDTVNAKVHRFGVMNNLPITMDEMTNATPEVVSDLAYCITQGRGKNRMMSATNEERDNSTRWSTIGIATGNASFVQKLSALKSTAEGELMRIMEINLDLTPSDDGGELLELLNTNYGLAGEIYAQHIVKHREDIPKLIGAMQDRIVSDAGAAVKERFWVRASAAILVGGLMARQAGLIDYDVSGTYEWALRNFSAQRVTAKEAVSMGDDSSVGDFLLSNFNAILVIDTTKINPLTLNNVVKHPSQRIMARYEPHRRRLYVVARDFKDYCVDRQLNYNDVLRNCKDGSMLRYNKSVTHRMASGTGVNLPPTQTLEFTVIDESILDVQYETC